MIGIVLLPTPALPGSGSKSIISAFKSGTPIGNDEAKIEKISFWIKI